MQNLQSEKLIYGITVTRDGRNEDLPYLVYVPTFDGYARGETIADALERARDFIGMAALENLISQRPLPESEYFVPQADPGQLALLVDVNLRTYRHLFESQEVIIRPVSELADPDELLSRVGSNQPVFLTEAGNGKYAVISLEDYNMYRDALEIVVRMEDEELA